MGGENKSVAPKIVFNADGSQSVVGPNGESTLVVPASAGGEAEVLTPAMRALQKLRGPSAQTSTIRSVRVAGDRWFLKRLNFGELTKLGMLTPRDEKGRLDLVAENTAGNLVAAVLFCTVVSGKTDPTPFFASFSEAWQFANDASDDVMAVVGALFQAALKLNPQVLPEAKREEVDWEDEAEREKKEMSGASESAPSSTPPTTPEPTSSIASDSNGAPASSPPGADASTSTSEET